MLCAIQSQGSLKERSMKRLILVEDDKQLRSVLSRSLRRLGYDVSEAATASEARNSIHNGAADIVLLDINLPDGTGWDVLRWLRTRPDPQPPVIVLSAVQPAPSRVQTLMPDAILTKPFPIDVLIRLIGRLTNDEEVTSLPA